MALYEIRLMFEWGSACLWGMNEAAKSKYGYAELERYLPLRDETKARLAELSDVHDTSLNWNDPTGPRPWSQEEFEQFDADALAVLRDVQSELGDLYAVWYDPL